MITYWHCDACGLSSSTRHLKHEGVYQVAMMIVDDHGRRSPTCDTSNAPNWDCIRITPDYEPKRTSEGAR